MGGWTFKVWLVWKGCQQEAYSLQKENGCMTQVFKVASE